MKVALVHDYVKEYGGAEKVLETLCDMFPDAPVYTSVYLPQYLGPHKERFKKLHIKTSFFQHLPFNAKLISPFRLLSPFVFKNFNFSSYDVIIVSQTGAYFPTLVTKGKAKLLCYTHTPPRYLYGYKTAREWKKNKIFLVLGELANHFLRMVDFKASQNVDQFIANSEEVHARIKKFYRKDAIVVYPPAVEISSGQLTDQISNKNQNTKYYMSDTEYYLTGGRLARAKGLDIIVRAFSKNRKRLKIFGKGFAGYEESLKFDVQSSKLNNIEFLGEVSDELKFELMKNAKAFIFASHDEDFGITPVEAQSVGTPVIAYKSGGVKETVVDGETGLFYEENTPESLRNAVEKFERMTFKIENCFKQAEKFSSKKFRAGIQNVIEGILK